MLPVALDHSYSAATILASGPSKESVPEPSKELMPGPSNDSIPGPSNQSIPGPSNQSVTKSIQSVTDSSDPFSAPGPAASSPTNSETESLPTDGSSQNG